MITKMLNYLAALLLLQELNQQITRANYSGAADQ
jgi:hypothetical protein